MTPEEFAAKMAALETDYSADTEGMHIEADKLMAKVLTGLGYEAGVVIYNEMRKWYS